MSDTYRLGEWTVRPQHASIERGDDVVHLKPKPMAVLHCLIRAGGEVVTRDQLFESVWPGGIVSDATLTQCIVELRRAFNDSAQSPQVIKTIPKVGFCLIPAIAELASEPGRSEHAAGQTRSSIWKRPGIFAGALVIALLLLGTWWYQLEDTKPAPEQPAPNNDINPSIAVLPFLNMSDESDNEYFVDGLTEEMQILLAKIPQLKVSARTSSFAFRNKDVTVTEIANTLNVAHILEGSVRKAGNRIRVSVKLIEVQNGFELWSESYDRKLDDIFAVQDDVAASVVGALRLNLLNDPPRLRETDADVYTLYLQGKYLMTPPRGSKEDLQSAVSIFEQVLAIDPGFARAWVGISWAYEYQRRTRVLPEAQAVELGREAAEKALAIDDQLALAWSTLAYTRKKYDWDFEGAEAAMDRALQLKPNISDVFLGLGSVASSIGQFEKSIELYERAVSLDPLSLEGVLSLARRYVVVGRYEEALQLCQQVLVLYPENKWALEGIAEIYLKQGFPERALVQLEGLPYTHNLNRLQAEALFVLGEKEESRALIGEFLATEPEFGAFTKAQIYTWQGENDKAFESLDLAFEQRSIGLHNFFLYNFHRLQGDPRYTEFLEKLGLLEAWTSAQTDQQ